MKAPVIRGWFNIHKWTSLICTAFLLMLCITGLPLIFYEEIDHLLHEEMEISTINAGVAAPSKDMILKNAMGELPGKEVKYIFWDEKEHPGQMFVTLADSSEAPIEADHYLTMDEGTGKVLETAPRELDFMLIMYYLHVEMLAGIPGKLFLGLMGVLFCIAFVSGVVLLGPFMGRFDFVLIWTEK